VIDGPEAAAAAGSEIIKAPAVPRRRTSISGAIDFAMWPAPTISLPRTRILEFKDDRRMQFFLVTRLASSRRRRTARVFHWWLKVFTNPERR